MLENIALVKGESLLLPKRGHALKVGTSMQAVIEKLLLAFIPLFVAIDPVGLVAIFLGFSGPTDTKDRQREGTYGLVTGLAGSIGFIFLGRIIFRGLGI